MEVQKTTGRVLLMVPQNYAKPNAKPRYNKKIETKERDLIRVLFVVAWFCVALCVISRLRFQRSDRPFSLASLKQESFIGQFQRP